MPYNLRTTKEIKYTNKYIYYSHNLLKRKNTKLLNLYMKKLNHVNKLISWIFDSELKNIKDEILIRYIVDKIIYCNIMYINLEKERKMLLNTITKINENNKFLSDCIK